MMKTTAVLASLALLCSCGSHVSDDDRDAGVGFDSAVVDSGPGDTGGGDADAAAACAFSNGVPKCGAEGCADPSADDCQACVQFYSDSKLTSFGACAKLDADKMWGKLGGSVCSFCVRSDLVCARTKYDEPDDLTCINPVVCEAASRDGLPATCRWTDKSTWRPATAIPNVACPATGTTLGMCGGACGDCAPGAFCTGRSPVHPLGICVAPTRMGPTGTVVNRCKRATGCNAATDSCLVFKVEAFEQVEADNHGVCVPTDRCKGLRDGLPGGVACFAVGGAAI